ncbi:hypothetical protein [uncultured Thiothrix sp.]|uniref:hypothetical protein n=1 Tax=uncultured Thiothrix sp. TaxID=223185 RepID=UPI002638FAA9|nr:hypothetical protein [uncultured Thiothrix sp.]
MSDCNRGDGESIKDFCRKLVNKNYKCCKLDSVVVVSSRGLTPQIIKVITDELNGIIENEQVPLEELIEFAVELRKEKRLTEANVVHQFINNKLNEISIINNNLEVDLYKMNLSEQIITLQKTRKFSELETTKNMLQVIELNER